MSMTEQATIARNVRMWRREKAKRAVRVEVKQKQPIAKAGEPITDVRLELEVTHREASQFGTRLELP